MPVEGYRTCTFALQRVVMLVILGPLTPGAFNSNIDWRIPSSSATQEDITAESMRRWQFTPELSEDFFASRM